MNVKTKVESISVDREDLISLLSTALYGDDTFMVFSDPEFSNIKSGDCYEENLADILLKGGYICVVDTLNSNEHSEKCKNHSKVLEVAEYSALCYQPEEFAPLYHLTLNRIKTALSEIISGDITCKYTKTLKNNYKNVFEEDFGGDFIDGYNLFQYIIFGDIIYG